MKHLSSNIIIYVLLMLFCFSFLSGCSTFSGRQISSDSPEKNDPEVAEGFALKDDSIWSDTESLKAMIISDLHYTENRELNTSIVPGIGVAEEITDAIVAEVIDKNPDVLIMTGDNTNSGDSADVSGLIPKLQSIKDKGISIILTTGNHDFDGMDAEEFERLYFELLNPVDRDPDSLSYTAIVKDVVFLAMDDNAVHPGGEGEFSAGTMQWISDMLDLYKDHPVIFLSHHNVLYGFGDADSGYHLIRNSELPDFLSKGGVKLILSGHMHLQYITERKGMWEILSGMPFSGSHLIGNLAVNEERMVYYAEPVDFDTYGSSVKEELERLDRESAVHMNQLFSEILDSEGLHGVKKSRVLALINRFFLYYGEGTLSEHAGELQDDPDYDRMIAALSGSNYGKWIKEMIETTRHSSRGLVVSR